MNISSPSANEPLKMPLRRNSYPRQHHHDCLHQHHQLHNEDFIPQRPFRRLSGSTISGDGESSTIGNISILSPLTEGAGDDVVLLAEVESHPRKEWRMSKGSCDAAAAKDVPIKKPARCGSAVASSSDDSTITTYYTTNMNDVGPEDQYQNYPIIKEIEETPRKKWLDVSIQKEDSPPKQPAHCGSVTLASIPPPGIDETSISSDMHAKEIKEEETEENASICDSLIKVHQKQKTLFSQNIYTLVHDPNNYKAKEQPNVKTPTVKILPRNAILMQRKRCVERFWNCMNQRDYKGALDQCTSDCNLVFRGYEYKIKKTVPVQAGLGRTKSVIDAIPDFTFRYSSIEQSCYVKGALVSLDFVCTGHHTGCALNLPPLPPIPVSNKHVVLDEAEQHYYFDSVTNKIKRIEEIALGETCGLMGVYVILSRS